MKSMQLIILKFHNFLYIFYDETKLLEVNEKQNKNLQFSSVDRKLQRTKYGHSIIGTGMTDDSFNLTREALKAKQKQLKQQGKGNKPKRAGTVTDKKTNIL